MNQVNLIGRMTKDIDVKITASNLAVGRFSLAINRMKKEDGADFVSCVAFRKTAEILQKYAGKGAQIGVTGRIQTGSYEKDGRKFFTTDVICERIELLGSKSESGAKPQPSADVPSGFVEMDDDDDGLPF